MLYVFPTDTFVVAISDYEKPYKNPIVARQGEFVSPVTDGSRETDFLGWTWCVGSDGRAGWTPNSWCEPTNAGWRLTRDFSALELTVRKGDRLRLLYSESGFLFCETMDSDQAWIPDAVVVIEATDCTSALKK